MNELGVRAGGVAALDIDDEQSLFMDWTVDGVSLRATYVDNRPDKFMTLLQDEAQYREDRTESLRRLRGDAIPAPTFEPRFRPTGLGRLLNRLVTPHAPWGTAFEDGRIALLFCVCGDLACPTLSTRLILHDDTVEWRDIGWQVTYEPFATGPLGSIDEVGHATFDRKQYELLINLLLCQSLAGE